MLAESLERIKNHWSYPLPLGRSFVKSRLVWLSRSRNATPSLKLAMYIRMYPSSKTMECYPSNIKNGVEGYQKSTLWPNSTHTPGRLKNNSSEFPSPPLEDTMPMKQCQTDTIHCLLLFQTIYIVTLPQ